MELPSAVTNRFKIDASLGRGGQGHAFRAHDLASGEVVVVKALDFLELTSWKDFDLWHREADVLRSLDHPALPKILWHYPEDTGGETPDAVIVVQEYVDGTTLEELLEERDGAPLMNEDDARAFLDEMLGILEYLHGLNPPVIHRDIKPSNIVRRPDGSHALIDFGAAQSRTALTGGSTFVGTNGYMPPEQLVGRAAPCSDLFALGATVIEAMTGMHPSNLSGDDLSFRLDVVPASDGFRAYLGRLTQPIPEKRYASATRAREALSGADGGLVLARDVIEGFELSRSESGVTTIKMPPPPRWNLVLATLFLAFSIILLFISSGGAAIIANIILSAMWAISSFRSLGRIEISDDEIRHRGFFFRKRRWALEEVLEARRRTGTSVWTSGIMLQTRDGKQQTLTGALQRRHADWLVATLNQHLEDHR